jgi:putative ABC transport system ATP-binding protein
LRGLWYRPSIILADEPTEPGFKTGEEIMQLLRVASSRNTIILVTHEADIAEHAHRAVRLRDGKIESDEPVRKRRLQAATSAS